MTIAYSSDGITAAREPARKYRFERDSMGRKEFLNMLDLSKTTRDANYAWSGTEKQALTVRARFPIAREFQLHPYLPRNSVRKD